MKKLLSLVAALALALLIAFPAFADGELVVDNADLLTSDEEADLTLLLKDLQSQYGLDVIVVTTEGIDGKTLEAYADDYYDEHGYSSDGIELLVNMDTANGGADRRYIISTIGYGITAFTDYGIEQIYDDISYYMSDGDYYGAFREYAYDAEWMLQQAENGDVYDGYVSTYVEPTFANVNWLTLIIWAVIIGVVVALIVTGSLKKQHKSVAKSTNAANYVVPGSLNITKSTDTFLYHTLTHVPIPRDNDNGHGGGSSTHMSSGGFSHGGGGGGRSF